jgi:uncharacterized membrane protein YecN with MAPEG domain
MHSAPYFTGLGLLTVLHAMRVIKFRRANLIPLGDGGRPELEVLMRVFGNHIEYVPLGLILLAALEFVQAPVWYIHLTGFTLLAGRVLHAYGLSRVRGKSFGRLSGMILTFTSLTLGSIGVSLFTLWNPFLHG